MVRRPAAPPAAPTAADVLGAHDSSVLPRGGALAPVRSRPPAVRRAAAPATPLARTRRVRKIDALLRDCFPDAVCELDFTTPLELAVATILSAQCTDARVNQVTPALFARYRSAADYAGADRLELEEYIRSTGFFHNKANSLIGLGQAVLERFGGELPRTLSELVTLPGFGRKTANVVLGNAFGIPGITVDTHLGRMVRRWGISAETDPVKVELELNAMLPPADWTDFSHRAIYHGRRVCHAKKPACGACYLAALCPSKGEGPLDPEAAAALITGPERPHLLALVGLSG